ncbi:MAG: ATP-binding protein [Candidatus Krumholzibacteria bacterium]|nr:ATP-binding protein [Candidatus Krumholzibacteria bacterium]
MRRKFRRDIGALDGLFSFAEEFETENGLDDSESYFLDLTLEELFTNLVRHARGSDDIDVEIELDGDLMTIRLTDRETKPFDGNSFREIDTKAPLMEREPGGLGIHLVKMMADSLEYDYDDGTLVIMATKRLEER